MTVRPASINFKLYSGATFTEPVTLLDSNNNPINLIGCAATLMARRDIADTIPLITLTSPTGITLGGVAGTITLNLTAAQTKALAIDWDGEIWFHDLLLTAADGVTVQRTYQGVITAFPGVTR